MSLSGSGQIGRHLRKHLAIVSWTTGSNTVGQKITCSVQPPLDALLNSNINETVGRVGNVAQVCRHLRPTLEFHTSSCHDSVHHQI